MLAHDLFATCFVMYVHICLLQHSQTRMSQVINGVQIGAIASVNFLTNFQKLHRGIWPWTVGLKSRLPFHYKQRYVEKFMRDPLPVHYRPDLRKCVADEFGCPTRVQNIPLPVFFPKESNDMLWGGEGIIAGFRKKNKRTKIPRVPRMWLPRLSSRVFYSEILDMFLRVTVTRSTLDLVDAAHGFDHYILSTPEVDMQSMLGMRLKRKLLVALANRTLWPNDPAKHDEVYAKYQKYVIPAEEAEWVGLSLYEAERKQHAIEEAERLKNIRPLKDVYAEELVEKLQTGLRDSEDQKAKSVFDRLGRLNPFQDKVE